ncbi:MAG: hypothetical protein U5L02_10275 [Rheinheimera sp.]|nr:hypothetical protein [Rheinheimera sp.]
MKPIIKAADLISERALMSVHGRSVSATSCTGGGLHRSVTIGSQQRKNQTVKLHFFVAALSLSATPQ